MEEASASYRFHALYRVSGKRIRRPAGLTGAEYLLTGRGNQTFAYSVNLNDTADPNNTRRNVADWHGSGAWRRNGGNIAILDVNGRRFALTMDVGLSGRPATIPLAVSSEETDFSTDDTQTCNGRYGQSGSTISVASDCASDFRSLTIPVRTAINPQALLGDEDPAFRTCRGTKTSIRDYNAFCGSAKRNGRIRRAYSHIIARPLDYPFRPFEDVSAALDAQIAAGLFNGPMGWWGELVLRSTFTVDLKPGK